MHAAGTRSAILRNHFKSSAGKCVFRSGQSNVKRLLPASDHCRARSNQIVEHKSDVSDGGCVERFTVLGSWEEPPKMCLTVVKNAFVG